MRKPPPYSTFPMYPVTAGTLLCAIIVTGAGMTKVVDLTPLYETGEIRRGELWRIVTSTFPHANVLHLLFNLYWTWVFGTLTEKVFGHIRTLAIFILLAVVGNGAEYAMLRGGVGLSGVGYGLFGMMWVLSTRDRRLIDAVDSPTIQMFVGWFFLCIVITFAGYPIANIAHGVGCAAGALLGWTIVSSKPGRWLGGVAMTCLVLATLAGDTIARPWVNLCRFAGGDTAKYADEDEFKFGYDALTANHNQSAVRWFSDAVQMNPTDAGAWFNLGISEARLHHHEQAVAAYEQACKLSPDDAQYRDALKSVD